MTHPTLPIWCERRSPRTQTPFCLQLCIANSVASLAITWPYPPAPSTVRRGGRLLASSEPFSNLIRMCWFGFNSLFFIAWIYCVIFCTCLYVRLRLLVWQQHNKWPETITCNIRLVAPTLTLTTQNTPTHYPHTNNPTKQTTYPVRVVPPHICFYQMVPNNSCFFVGTSRSFENGAHY